MLKRKYDNTGKVWYSRKNKSAIEHTLHKKLTYDIIRQCHLPAVYYCNGANARYDRIVHAIVSLALSKTGHEDRLNPMLSTIQ